MAERAEPSTTAEDSPDGGLLAQLHQLLADARSQQTVLRESLATVIGFLERPTPG